MLARPMSRGLNTVNQSHRQAVQRLTIAILFFAYILVEDIKPKCGSSLDLTGRQNHNSDTPPCSTAGQYEPRDGLYLYARDVSVVLPWPITLGLLA